MSMTKGEVALTLMAAGWERDRFGHFKKELRVAGKPALFRVKLQDKVVRLEKQVVYDFLSHQEKGWVRVGGDYYGKIFTFEQDGKLKLRLGNSILKIKELS